MNISDTPNIGPVVQQRRKALGLTLGQLAEMSGVSKSMLSQIERSEANPTFAILWALMRAMRIDFADLVEGGANPAQNDLIELVRLEDTPEIRSADGLCRLRILSPPRLAGWTEWYEVEFAPLARLESAAHAVGTFEHFTAGNASFEVTSGGATRPLRARETARYPADLPHCIANLSKRISRGFLVVLYRGATTK